MWVAGHSSSYGFLQLHHWLVAHVLLGTGTAVVVMSAGQCDTHGGEGGLDVHQRTQEKGNYPQQHGYAINKRVGKVVARGIVA